MPEIQSVKDTGPPVSAEELRLIYQEIVEGYTYEPFENLFIKHLGELDYIELTRKQHEFIKRYSLQGIPTEIERIKRLKQDEEWTENIDSDILAYRQSISDTEKQWLVTIPQQKKVMQTMIDSLRTDLRKALNNRYELLGTTADSLADKDSNNYFAFLSLYKNKECSIPFCNTWEDFEALGEDEVSKYMTAIDKTLERFKEINIRRISCLPYFINVLSFCKDNVYYFLNKPLSKLSHFQHHLISLGVRNLNILSQAEASPPEYFEKINADEIVQWYDIQYSVILGKREEAHQQRRNRV